VRENGVYIRIAGEQNLRYGSSKKTILHRRGGVGTPTSLTRREQVCVCAQCRSRDAMAGCYVSPGYPQRGLEEAEASFRPTAWSAHPFEDDSRRMRIGSYMPSARVVW
jgi:hypothetical protein